jgi:hypothetical protein
VREEKQTVGEREGGIERCLESAIVSKESLLFLGDGVSLLDQSGFTTRIRGVEIRLVQGIGDGEEGDDAAGGRERIEPRALPPRTTTSTSEQGGSFIVIVIIQKYMTIVDLEITMVSTIQSLRRGLFLISLDDTRRRDLNWGGSRGRKSFDSSLPRLVQRVEEE